MKTKDNTLQKSQNNILAFNDLLFASLLKTELRTGKNLLNIDETIIDIKEEFKHLRAEQIIKAIRNGSLGLYGSTYNLSTQQICIWIREYLKPSKSSTGAL
jgi:carbonic anhydrase